MRALVAAADADKDVAGVAAASVNAARALIARSSGPLTVVLGRASLAESRRRSVDAAGAVVAARPDARFLPALRRCNVHGALDMGLAPGLLPGRVTLDDGRDWFAGTWPTVPAAAGLDAEGILRAAADGRIDVLVLLGADPLADFPDRDLAERALAGARTVIAVDTFLNASSRQADVVLAAAGFAEKAGTTTNLEGRVSSLSPAGHAAGHRPPRLDDRRRAGRCASAPTSASTDAGEVLAEIGRVAPSHLGLTVELVNATPDGVLLPLPAEAEPVAADDADGRWRRRCRRRPPTPTAPRRPSRGRRRHRGRGRRHRRGRGRRRRDAGDAAADARSAFAAGAPGPVPPLDAYSFRLVATRKLYDQGTLVQASSPAGRPGARHRRPRQPLDADRLGVAAGDRVVLALGPHARSPCRCTPTPACPAGPWPWSLNQADARVGDLDRRRRRRSPTCASRRLR